MYLHRGFNLIELMVVITIIALLVALALPAYQNYTIRTKVSEAFTLSSAAKTSVTEFYQETGQWPLDNSEAGLDEAQDLQGTYVSEIRVNRAFIEVVLGPNVPEALLGKSVVFAGVATPSGQVSWHCSSETIEGKYLPAACR